MKTIHETNPCCSMFSIASILLICLSSTALPAQECNSYDDCLQKGMNSLVIRDVSKAKSYFKDAKRYARKGNDKDSKDDMKTLMNVVEDYETEYFRTLNKSVFLQKSRQYKEILTLYEVALQQFKRINRKDVGALLKNTDQQIIDAHNREVKKYENFYNKEVEIAVASGKSTLKADPAASIKQFEWVQSQVNKTKAQEIGLDGLLNDSYYNLYFQEGKRQDNAGNLESALSYYQKAQSRKDNPEIKSLIQNTRQRLYEKMMRDGEQYATSGQYKLAKYSFDRAKEFTDNISAVNSRVEFWYTSLFENGQKAYANTTYSSALTYFNGAEEFKQTNEVRVAKDKTYYKIYYNDAYAALEQGDVSKANTQINQALSYQSNSSEALAIKDKVDRYYSAFNYARKQLNDGESNTALSSVRSAQAIVPNASEAQALEKTILGYKQAYQQAQNLASTDPDRALVYAREAETYASTNNVRQLQNELTRVINAREEAKRQAQVKAEADARARAEAAARAQAQAQKTNVFITLSSRFANCDVSNANLVIIGSTEREEKYVPGGKWITLDKPGTYTISLKGMDCRSNRNNQGGGDVGVSSQALTSNPSVRFQCSGGTINQKVME
ncbi:MAG: hypothetical protein NW218_10200 [Saprospiraceae bacterium]|nr:hypothetical protein [Saprospiraceae bacterium]